MTDRFGDKYAFLQLIAAQAVSNDQKVSRWKSVLSGILSGELTIGSRAPVSGMPTWATPEVVRGGFATGAYAAGGALLDHEIALASKLGLQTKSVSIVRETINTWYLTDAGIDELKQLIHERRFRVDQPEEAALLTVALLVDSQHESATKIVSTISPFFDRLRFYPRPVQHSLTDGVHVHSIEQVRSVLSQVKPSNNIKVQTATLETWIPLYDRLIDLLEFTDASNWKENANQWLEDYQLADKKYMSRRWAAPDSPFTRCRIVLGRLIRLQTVSAKERNYVSLVIERHQAKYGTREVRQQKRARQAQQNVQVWFNEIAGIILERTLSLPGEDGISCADDVLKNVSPQEARPKAPEHAHIPTNVQKKVKKAQKGTIAELIQDGQITSPEVLAEVLPQITAQVHASGFDDENSALVFREAYKAFHRRRSLLLLNLEAQVKVTELPWVSALLNTRSDAPQDIQLSRTALSELVYRTLTHFPYIQFPNPLVEQMQGLGQRAEIAAPFVPELAADIFMGRFSPRFEQAAMATVQYFEGKLYSRYYDLPYDIQKGTFDQLCHDRVDGLSRQGWSVAQNGMILEQAMILTSHNMAAVFSELDLSELDKVRSAQSCFEWVCQRLSLVPASHHAELISLKNSAYAWRQMIALLSELEDAALAASVDQMNLMLGRQATGLQARLRPVMEALQAAALDPNFRASRSQQFLGWTLARHPLAREQNTDS